jgi:predicted nucleotidyltransferase
MLGDLITSKTRIKLLLKFFLNSSTQAYLRGLESEFGESTNSIRLELNHLENAGLLVAQDLGNRRMYRANPSYPLFPEIKKILHKHLGIDQILEQVVEKLGSVELVYLTGTFAHGTDGPNIDVLLVGNNIDVAYLDMLIVKAKPLVERNICYKLIDSVEFRLTFKEMSQKDMLLLWQHKN